MPGGKKIAAGLIVCLGIAIPVYYTSVSDVHSRMRSKIEKNAETKEEVLVRQKVMEQEMKFYNEKLDYIIKTIRELREFQKNIPHGKIVIEGSDDTN